MPRIVLVQPDADGLLSGGYLYNAQMTRALMYGGMRDRIVA